MSCNLNVFLAVSINIYTDKFNLFSGMAFTYNTIPFPNEFTTKLPFYRTTPFLYEIRCNPIYQEKACIQLKDRRNFL